MVEHSRRNFIKAMFTAPSLLILENIVKPIKALGWLEEPLPQEVDPSKPTNMTTVPRLEAICHKSIAEKAVKDSPCTELKEFKRAFVQGSIDEDRYIDSDEMDTKIVPSRKHFLNPNAPEGKQGLYLMGVQQENSYERAVKLWERSIERYKAGEKEKAYHDFGRVAHLIMDAAQPEHTKCVDHFIKRTEGASPAWDHVGSPLEKWAASHSLKDLLWVAVIIAENFTPESDLKGLFYGMARESSGQNAPEMYKEILAKYFRDATAEHITTKWNGMYVNNWATDNIRDEDAIKITGYVMPRLMRRLEKLVELWNDEIGKRKEESGASEKSLDKILPQHYRQMFDMSPTDAAEHLRKSGQQLLIRINEVTKSGLDATINASDITQILHLAENPIAIHVGYSQQKQNDGSRITFQVEYHDSVGVHHTNEKPVYPADKDAERAITALTMLLGRPTQSPRSEITQWTNHPYFALIEVYGKKLLLNYSLTKRNAAQTRESELDLNTPEKSVIYFNQSRAILDLQGLERVTTPELYKTFNDGETRSILGDLHKLEAWKKQFPNWRILETRYLSPDEANVTVEYEFLNGKREKDIERVKKIGSKWLVFST